MRLAFLLLALTFYWTLAQSEPYGSYRADSGPVSATQAADDGELSSQAEAQGTETRDAEEDQHAKEGPPRWLWFLITATGTLSLGGRLVMPLLLWRKRGSSEFK